MGRTAVERGWLLAQNSERGSTKGKNRKKREYRGDGPRVDAICMEGES